MWLRLLLLQMTTVPCSSSRDVLNVQEQIPLSKAVQAITDEIYSKINSNIFFIRKSSSIAAFNYQSLILNDVLQGINNNITRPISSSIEENVSNRSYVSNLFNVILIDNYESFVNLGKMGFFHLFGYYTIILTNTSYNNHLETIKKILNDLWLLYVINDFIATQERLFGRILYIFSVYKLLLRKSDSG